MKTNRTARQIAFKLAALGLVVLAGCGPDTRAARDPLTWDDLAERPSPRPDKSFRYGADTYQVVDLWRPRGAGLHPVVLMVHGGCWTSAIADRTLMNHVAGDLRGRGYAVWNIDYRGVDRPGGGFDGIFADVAAAADGLRGQAAAHALDIRRVVAVGHSAGGHLALWLAARRRVPGAFLSRQDDPLPIAHVVSLGGLPDLEQAYNETQGCGRDPIADLAAPPAWKLRLADAQARRDLLIDKSIPLLAPLGVPQTLVNGDADKIIPTRFATDYAEKMRARGDAVTVRIVPGQGHVELVAPDTPAWAVAVDAIDRAFGRAPGRPS